MAVLAGVVAQVAADKLGDIGPFQACTRQEDGGTRKVERQGAAEADRGGSCCEAEACV